MKNWFDKQQLWCPSCGHRWILISNKEITNIEHNIWIKAVLEHHKLIKEEREAK